MSSTQDLYGRIESVAKRAGRDPPSSYELLDIASDLAALALIDLMEKLVARQRVGRSILIGDCLSIVLCALSDYRNTQAWSPSSGVNFVKQLKNARDKDIPKLLDRLLANPTSSQEVLVAVYRGAVAEGVIETRTKGGVVEERVVLPGKRSNWVRGELTWLTKLREYPSLLKLAIDAMRDVEPETCKASLMRRLRELKQYPTARRLDALLAEAEKLDGANYILNAMRYVVRTSLFQNKPLPEIWLAVLKNDPEKLSKAAAGTLKFLTEAGDSSGRKSSPTLDRYCDRISGVWKTLTDTDISYTTSTETRNDRGLATRSGRGLQFMQLAMKLIDASATSNQARGQIDRIRGWGKRNKRQLPGGAIA